MMILTKAALLIASCGGLVLGSPVSPASISGALRDSDLVVVGTANVTFNAGLYSGSILVSEVLKGKTTIGSAIPMSWREPPNPAVIRMPGLPEKPIQVSGIFFLRIAPGPSQLITLMNGSSSFRDSYLPTMPRASRGPITVANSSHVKTALDRIVLEIVSCSEAGLPLRYDLVGLYKETRSPVLVAAFRAFQMSTDQEVAAVGHAGAIATGDASSIGSIYRNAKTLSTARRWGSVLSEMRQFSDPANTSAIAALETIVSDQSTRPPLREAAAISLGKMHTRQSLPYLAALLSEPSLTLRVAAVGGLALFANNVPVGSYTPAAGPSPYRDDQTIAHSAWDEAIVRRDGSYTTFWQTWWLVHRTELTATTR